MTHRTFPWPTIALAGALVFLASVILDAAGVARAGPAMVLVVLGSAFAARALIPFAPRDPANAKKPGHR